MSTGNSMCIMVQATGQETYTVPDGYDPTKSDGPLNFRHIACNHLMVISGAGVEQVAGKAENVLLVTCNTCHEQRRELAFFFVGALRSLVTHRKNSLGLSCLLVRVGPAPLEGEAWWVGIQVTCPSCKMEQTLTVDDRVFLVGGTCSPRRNAVQCGNWDCENLITDDALQ